MHGVFCPVLTVEEMLIAISAIQRHYKQDAKVILDLEYSQDFMEQ
jgi:hypothetical protein